ncbi:Transposase [Phytophthora megakarya]|uniref:Transposase n=1 Tax=Phytophthora megakarya TaxID=4795 RepID=A0A225VBM5_9STRA|nr:Transposase [Phytophthora megakarya]
MDTTVIFSREIIRRTFSRKEFHKAFQKKAAPLLNPWPLLRSIVILDNARIHMYRELEELVQALLFFLPPYCPQLNPISVFFVAQAMDNT